MNFPKSVPMEITNINKDKAIPLLAWTDHEGSRWLRLLREQRENTHNSINRAHKATCPGKVVPRNNKEANK
jgi:hypothetical protein